MKFSVLTEKRVGFSLSEILTPSRLIGQTNAVFRYSSLQTEGKKQSKKAAKARLFSRENARSHSKSTHIIARFFPNCKNFIGVRINFIHPPSTKLGLFLSQTSKLLPFARCSFQRRETTVKRKEPDLQKTERRETLSALFSVVFSD